MSSRYDGKRVYTNNNEIYKEALSNRGLSQIKHFEMSKLKYPTIEEMQDLQMVGYTWSQEDRLWKVAAKYYGNASLWYIIGWFNKTPTDFHIKVGSTIYIPFPIEKVMKYLGL
jgi:hypothetical protein